MWSKANRFVFLCLSRFLCLSGVLLTLVFCFLPSLILIQCFHCSHVSFVFVFFVIFFAFCVFSAQSMRQMQFSSHGAAQDTQLAQFVFTSAHRAPS